MHSQRDKDFERDNPQKRDEEETALVHSVSQQMDELAQQLQRMLDQFQHMGSQQEKAASVEAESSQSLVSREFISLGIALEAELAKLHPTPESVNHVIMQIAIKLSSYTEELNTLSLSQANPARRTALCAIIFLFLETFPTLFPSSEIGHLMMMFADAQQEVAQQSLKTDPGAVFFFNQAIHYYEGSIKVFGLDDMVEQQARALLRKGAALYDWAVRHVEPETATLFEQAINCFDEASSLFEQLNMPEGQATAQKNKGVVLKMLASRCRGTEGIALYKQVLACYDIALAIYERHKISSGASLLQEKGFVLRLLAKQLAEMERIPQIEQAVSTYEQALTIFESTHQFSEYASTLMEKGHALAKWAALCAGAEGKNLFEQAINCYDTALTLQKAGSTDYAITLLNKGTTLVSMAEKIGGIDAVPLFQQAIDCCDASTDLLDVNTMAIEYALAQQNRGLARFRLAEVTGGARGIMLFEQAITCFDIALKIRDRTTMPLQHARTQMNKGTALQALAERRPSAEGEILFEQAIACYDVALDVFDRTTDPFYFAMAQQNKANALRTLAERRSVAQGVPLLEQALACCNTALTISDAVTTPSLQAAILLNKGAVLEALAETQESVKKARSLEQAIECLDEVLKLCDRTAMATQWARAQMNKGNALRDLGELQSEAEAINFFKQAITCYDAALEIRDRTGMAPQHAKTQQNKAVTLIRLAERLAGSQEILFIEQAIECFNAVLEIYDSTTMPLEHAETQMRKGNTLHILAASYQLVTQQSRDKAVFRFKQAIDCFEVALKIYTSMKTESRCTEAEINLWHTLMKMIEILEGVEKKLEILQTHQELPLSDRLIEGMYRRAASFRQQGNIAMAISIEHSLTFLIDARRYGIYTACNNFEQRQATDEQIGQLVQLVNSYFALAQLADATDKQMSLIRQQKEVWLSDSNLELLQSAIAQAQIAHLTSTAAELERLYERFTAVHELAISVATLDAFGDVLEAKTWENLQDVLEKTLNYVSSDNHLAFLRDSVTSSRDSGKNQEAEETEAYFQLFYDARFRGIEEACKRFKMRRNHSMVQRLQINEVLQDLLQTRNASAAFEILREQEELLRSDLAIECIRKNIEEYRRRDEPEVITYLEQYLHLLEDLKGQDLRDVWQTFQYIPPPSRGSPYVHHLMHEYIDLPHIPENMPRKIDLLNLILQSPEGEQDPGLKAMVLAECADCYLETPEGERAESIEQAIKDISTAIELYEHVWEIFSEQEYSEILPHDKALLYHRLGWAYRARIYGNAAENIEKGLEYLRIALAFCNQDTKESTKAVILCSRGSTYKERIRGEPAENIELAIQDLLAGLEIFQRNEEENAYSIATAHYNLGSAYRQRIHGVMADNIEQAIEHYDSALEGFTPETTPTDWAMTLIGRGNAYLDRVRGRAKINNDNALADFTAALEVLTSELTPYLWALAHMNRGNAYAERREGDQGKNLERALEDFDAALTVFTREKTPRDWALLHMNRGNAYASLAATNGEKIATSDKTTYLEKAIADFDAALTIYTADPHDWAKVHLNRGGAHSQFPSETRSMHLQLALLDLDSALEVYTLKAAPRLYRNTQINRAYVLEKLGRWRDAHDAYIAIREVIQLLLETAPNDEERAEILQENLHQNYYLRDAEVLLHFDPPDLQGAICALEEGKAQNLRTALDLDTVKNYHAGNPQARERIQSLLAARDAWREVQRVAAAPLPKEMTIEERNAEIAERRRQLDEAFSNFIRIRESIRTLDNPAFLTPTSDFASIAQAVPSAEEALVYLVPGEITGHAFVITRDQFDEPKVHYIPLPLLKRETLDDLLLTEHRIVHVHSTGILQTSSYVGGWLLGQRQAAFEYLQQWGNSLYGAYHFLSFISDISERGSFKAAAHRIITDWSQDPKLRILLDQPIAVMNAAEQACLKSCFNRGVLSLELERILPLLGDLALSEVSRFLHEEKIRKVTFVPYGLLSLFPLSSSLIRHPDGQSYLSDIFEVAVTPNARSLKIALERAAQLSHEELLRVVTVGNPLPLPYGRGNLPYAEKEAVTVQRIAHAFHPQAKSHALLTTAATKEAVVQDLEGASYAHMAVHGYYHDDEPRRSRLVLAGDEHVPEARRSIYLGEALDGSVNLNGLRLLVLSGCETALTDIEQLDEAIGLATGFLQAGSSGIIASLWAVNDHATYLLMSRFAQLYLDPRRKMSPAKALAEAQRWLRESATNRVLETYNPTQPVPLESEAQSMPVLKQDNSFESRTSEQINPILRSLDYTHSDEFTGLSSKIESQSAKELDAFPYADPIYWAAFVVTGC